MIVVLAKFFGKFQTVLLKGLIRYSIQYNIVMNTYIYINYYMILNFSIIKVPLMLVYVTLTQQKLYIITGFLLNQYT